MLFTLFDSNQNMLYLQWTVKWEKYWLGLAYIQIILCSVHTNAHLEHLRRFTNFRNLPCGKNIWNAHLTIGKFDYWHFWLFGYLANLAILANLILANNLFYLKGSSKDWHKQCRVNLLACIYVINKKSYVHEV